MNETQAPAIESDSKRFSRALWSAVLWPAAVILITAGLMLAMIIILMKMVKWSEHSYEVIAQTHTCERLIVDVQNGIRGYELGGDNAFPTTFANDRIQVDHAFGKLQQLVADNPPQKSVIDGIIQLKNVWFDHARMSVAQRAQLVGPVNEYWLREGDEQISQLRSQLQGFTEGEENLHDQRLKNVQAAKRALIFAGTALSLILVITVGVLVRRQFLALAVDYRAALHTIEQRHAALARSESDLEEQKEWFRVTLTSIGDGVIVTDREGRVVFMNHEAERLTGFPGVESLLKPLSAIFRLINEETRSKEEDPVNRVFREKRVVGTSRHAVLISKMGEEWPIEDSAAPIQDAQGALIGVVLVFHNVVETRRAQNALRSHSEELEKRVTERTTTLQQMVTELEAFSYTVSHDLRSPLRAMQGFAQAVLEDFGDKLDDQGRNYLERIKNAAERLDRLIQDLLSYTRLSRQSVPLVPLNMDKILRDIIGTYPNLHSPVAEVEILGTLPHVLGHEASLTQILSNLLGNAAKFVKTGVTPHIRIWSENSDSRMRLFIQDNGIGVSPENYERIFQMFVQVDESHLYDGTGVGLAIVKRAVESMQGKVGIASSVEGGSRFWVELTKA